MRHRCDRATRALVLVLVAAVFSATCATPTSGPTDSVVGPRTSTEADARTSRASAAGRGTLEVVVPVFDPGLPADESSKVENGIFPELRKAEAVRFAHKLKLKLEETQAFETVRVVPDAETSADLYVTGEILESDGEAFKIRVTAADVSNKLWLSETFSHKSSPEFFRNPRNASKDPYDPLFAKAAQAVAAELRKTSSERLAEIERIGEIRFGLNMNDEAFAFYGSWRKKAFVLTGFPDETDPMLKRVRAARVKDRMFVDDWQTWYENFSMDMDQSYRQWQEESMTEVVARRKARNEAIAAALVGALAVAGAAASASASQGTDLGAVGAIVAGTVAVSAVAKAVEAGKQAKFHREALHEIAHSIDAEMAPRVTKLEEREVVLTGDAAEQFRQWRILLREVYAEEAVPDFEL